MGFVVVSHENLNANQIKTKLEETTQDCKPSTNNEDFNRKDFNSLVVCFLSHGYNGGIYGSDGEKVTIHEAQFFFNSQNCRGFHNKPKVFIVDACRVYDHNALQLIQGRLHLIKVYYYIVCNVYAHEVISTNLFNQIYQIQSKPILFCIIDLNNLHTFIQVSHLVCLRNCAKMKR